MTWKERVGVFGDVPRPATPPQSNPMITHEMVEVLGVTDDPYNFTANWPCVRGRTRCGRILYLDRTTDNGRPCRQCYPRTRHDPSSLNEGSE